MTTITATTPIDYSQDIQKLQETVAHLELTVDDLNQVIAKQDKELQDIQRQMKLMYNHLQTNSADGDGIAPFDLMADKPPHY